MPRGGTAVAPDSGFDPVIHAWHERAKNAKEIETNLVELADKVAVRQSLFPAREPTTAAGNRWLARAYKALIGPELNGSEREKALKSCETRTVDVVTAKGITKTPIHEILLSRVQRLRNDINGFVTPTIVQESLERAGITADDVTVDAISDMLQREDLDVEDRDEDGMPVYSCPKLFTFISAVALGAYRKMKKLVKAEMAMATKAQIGKGAKLERMPVREYMTAPVLALVIARAVWHLEKGGKEAKSSIIRSGGNGTLQGINGEFVKDVSKITDALKDANYQAKLDSFTLEPRESGAVGVRAREEGGT